MKNYRLLALLFMMLTIITCAMFICQGNPVIYKTLASSTFLIWGALNVWHARKSDWAGRKSFSLLMFGGLFFAFWGDILLTSDFICGAISFALGHVMFFLAFCRIRKFHWQDVFPIGFMIAISMAIIGFSSVELGQNQSLVIAYAVIISCMLGKSITLLRNKTSVSFVLFIGSLMFFLSDMFLMFSLFGNGGRLFSLLCLSFYYPAEYVLASSIGIFYNKNTAI